MLKEALTFTRRTAILLEVSFEGTTEEYALAWLKLTNNAREYSNMIWKIWNNPTSNVFVVCNPKYAEQIKEFCTGIISYYHADTDTMNYIGKVVSEEEITVGVPLYEYESTVADCNSDEWDEDISKGINELDWLPVVVE